MEYPFMTASEIRQEDKVATVMLDAGVVRFGSTHSNPITEHDSQRIYASQKEVKSSVLNHSREIITIFTNWSKAELKPVLLSFLPIPIRNYVYFRSFQVVFTSLYLSLWTA